jgi:hypothetical protein
MNWLSREPLNLLPGWTTGEECRLRIFGWIMLLLYKSAASILTPISLGTPTPTLQHLTGSGKMERIALSIIIEFGVLLTRT